MDDCCLVFETLKYVNVVDVNVVDVNVVDVSFCCLFFGFLIACFWIPGSMWPLSTLIFHMLFSPWPTTYGKRQRQE
jgi:hypothetical protein